MKSFGVILMLFSLASSPAIAWAGDCDAQCDQVISAGAGTAGSTTQLAPQCAAYKSADQAQGGDKTVMMLDMAAAAACGAACVKPALAQMCTSAGISSSVMEAFQSMQQASSGASGMISKLGSAGGAAAAYKAQSTPTQAGSKNKMACAAAAVYAVTGGLRAKNAGSQEDTKDTACNAVQSLSSGSSIPGGSAGTTTGSASGSISGNGLAAVKDNLSCVGKNGLQGCSDSPSTMSSATDGGLLSRSGMDRAVAPSALESLAQLKNLGRPNASAVLGGMLDPALGDYGKRLAALAEYAQKHPHEFLGMVPSSAPISGNHGARAKKHAFSFLNFNPNITKKNASQREVGFRKLSGVPKIPEGDIWHAGWKGSIFQIVSGKIVETKDRVDQLEWSSPLNRALMGLPNRSRK